MDSALKAKWVEALRSGEFKQTRGYLCRINDDNRSFCCLGVALEIQGAQWAETPAGLIGSYPPDCTFNGEVYRGNALEDALKSAFPGMPVEIILALMNKNDNGVTFPIIADYIEKNL